MKLDELRSRAKRGEVDPEDMGECQMDGCESNATERDLDGKWCWVHRNKWFREVITSSKEEDRFGTTATGAFFEPKE